MTVPNPELLALAQIALAAGGRIMTIYNSDFAAATKADASPVTAADTEAEVIILAALALHWPHIPVIAEEQAAAGHASQAAPSFFLVDPLDGTKEFISKNGEFTVNIARVENGRPVAGVVYAPALNEIYVGAAGLGAFTAKAAPQADAQSLSWAEISTRPRPVNGPTILASRSHRDAETEAFIAAQGPATIINAGSSLKFCRVAQGMADLYPRFGRTMEWDTAAGHAVLAAAGGQVTQPTGAPFTYGKPSFANGPFIASGQ